MVYVLITSYNSGFFVAKLKNQPHFDKENKESIMKAVILQVMRG